MNVNFFVNLSSSLQFFIFKIYLLVWFMLLFSIFILNYTIVSFFALLLFPQFCIRNRVFLLVHVQTFGKRRNQMLCSSPFAIVESREWFISIVFSLTCIIKRLTHYSTWTRDLSAEGHTIGTNRLWKMKRYRILWKMEMCRICNNFILLQVSSKRYQQCGFSSFISLVCNMFRWWHCICFSRNGLFWSQSKPSYCSFGNSTGPCKFKWERWDFCLCFCYLGWDFANCLLFIISLLYESWENISTVD